jgi:A/G-specific adenine glycosylase
MAYSQAQENKIYFQEVLIDWFERNGREFPWRVRSTPYSILIAEKLLQQTAVRTELVEIFNKLVSNYPSLESLANSQVTDLEKMIEPLGLKYRADEFYKIANEIIKNYNGKVPRDFDKLKELPGVGEYTARAILSFAFNEDIAVVDTNVARFLHRIFGIKEPIPSNPARKKSLIELAEKLIPRGKSKKFNLAILDLCAMICKPKNPRCSECPINAYCNDYSQSALATTA